MIGAVFLELHPSKEMHIGGVSAEVGQREGNLRLSNRLILFRVVDKTLLDELAAPSAPAGPKAELEKTDGERGGWNGSDDPDERLLAAEFRTHILAEDGRLEVGKDGRCCHGRAVF